MSSITEKRNIINIIRKIAGVDKLNLVKADICNVDSVDEGNGQIDCTSIMGEAEVQYKEVMLNAQGNDGIIAIPAVNSNVVIITLKNNQSFVISCSDIDKYICVIDVNNSFQFDANGFVFNGGNNGGMVLVRALLTKINRLENLFNAHVHTGVQVGSGSTGTTPTTALPITQLSDIENNKIQQ